MEVYNIDVSGESGYDFNVELSSEELLGVLKVLSKCNELGEYNDSFIVTNKKLNEVLLTWL